MLSSTIIWQKGPALGGGGTAGTDKENGAPLFYDGDMLLIRIDCDPGPGFAVVSIACDEGYFKVTDMGTGDDYDDWGPAEWSWWAKLDKTNLPPA